MAAQLSSIPDTPLPPPILTTPRLHIRPMHPQDAPSMQHHAAPYSITRYMTLAFAHPYTLAHATTWITLNLTSALPNYIISEAATPHIIIGGIGFKRGADVSAHTAEIGYWLGEPFWGRGYTTEALAAVTAWGFAEMQGLRRVWAGVFEGNDASGRCLEKCGYRREGVMRGHVEKGGEVMDLHVFGLTKADWEEDRRREEGIVGRIDGIGLGGYLEE
ncbi:acyl-CoA N-acyltransferase [Massariosphaeria phaeospora]|uniref:Acyl-CoA N-acyltransferase n=1 Tax=Massariosphaeria phaeospora TaxID=100035 RepID=A0A7C8MB40_9PLEO|nr:acyl-CoA N-acyltransferase [Massariosphaeria phaeospora]